MKILLKNAIAAVLIIAIAVSCKVTFITGYDSVIDETATKLKTDFNLFFIRLSRTLCDKDPNSQNISNFQDYYDHMEVDLITIRDRALVLKDKSEIVKKQITNIDSVMHNFEDQHRKGFKEIDCSAEIKDDKHDMANSVNLSIDALTRLQAELKTSGNISSPQ